jgi:hypothetical protein
MNKKPRRQYFWHDMIRRNADPGMNVVVFGLELRCLGSDPCPGKSIVGKNFEQF